MKNYKIREREIILSSLIIIIIQKSKGDDYQVEHKKEREENQKVNTEKLSSRLRRSSNTKSN